MLWVKKKSFERLQISRVKTLPLALEKTPEFAVYLTRLSTDRQVVLSQTRNHLGFQNY